MRRREQPIRKAAMHASMEHGVATHSMATALMVLRCASSSKICTDAEKVGRYIRSTSLNISIKHHGRAFYFASCFAHGASTKKDFYSQVSELPPSFARRVTSHAVRR